MSEASITVVMTGLVTITMGVVGFLTLWVKLRYSADKAEEAATKAKIVESKLDANTATTNLLDKKTDTIVDQTNGSMEATRALIKTIAERVDKLESYNHNSAHRVLDALNAVHLKVAEMVALQSKLTILPTILPTDTNPPTLTTPMPEKQ